jgi:hypothetical protein
LARLKFFLFSLAPSQKSLLITVIADYFPVHTLESANVEVTYNTVWRVTHKSHAKCGFTDHRFQISTFFYLYPVFGNRVFGYWSAASNICTSEKNIWLHPQRSKISAERTVRASETSFLLFISPMWCVRLWNILYPVSNVRKFFFYGSLLCFLCN